MSGSKTGFYSQHGEDFLLLQFFASKPTGFYLDVGAFDGVHLSNSFAFEQLGWQGICVEAHPGYFPLCREARPGALCLNVACTADPGVTEVEFFADKSGLFSGLRPGRDDEVRSHYESAWGLDFEGFETIRVPARTLTEILREHGPAETPIDFISVDVEGSELEVLEGLDLEAFRPRVLLIEANNDSAHEAIGDYLGRFGYFEARRLDVNSFFVHRQEDRDRIRQISIDFVAEKSLHPLGEDFTFSGFRERRHRNEIEEYDASLRELKARQRRLQESHDTLVREHGLLAQEHEQLLGHHEELTLRLRRIDRLRQTSQAYFSAYKARQKKLRREPPPSEPGLFQQKFDALLRKLVAGGSFAQNLSGWLEPGRGLTRSLLSLGPLQSFKGVLQADTKWRELAWKYAEQRGLYWQLKSLEQRFWAAWGEGKPRPIPAPARVQEPEATQGVHSARVQALAAARAFPGEIPEAALLEVHQLGRKLRKVLVLRGTPEALQVMTMLQAAGASGLCLDYSAGEEWLGENWASSTLGLAAWLCTRWPTGLHEVDALFVPSGCQEEWSLLQGRLGARMAILTSAAPESLPHAFRNSSPPARDLNGLLMFDPPPAACLDPVLAQMAWTDPPAWPRDVRPAPVPSTLPSGRPWPKITVVTATLNQASFLEETIQSVLAQAYPNLEYLIFDGGSSDGTQAILDKYRARLTHCFSGPDGGQADALNKGLSLGSGDILCWLNSDDRFAPGALLRVAQAFDCYGTDVVVGGCSLFHDRQTRPTRLHHCCLPGGVPCPMPLDKLLDLEGSWQRGDFFYQPEVFWSRAIWQRCGGRLNAGLHYSFDYELWVTMAAQGARVVHIPETLALFRLHEKQKTFGEDLPFLGELRQVNARLRRETHGQKTDA